MTSLGPPPGSAAALGWNADEVATLRDAFDRSFAEPLREPIVEVDVIAVQAGGGPCAFAQRDIAALRTDLAITPLPSDNPAMRGVASFHGALIAVWDLGLLLHGAPVASLRWCAVVRDETVAVAFDRLDGRLRVPAPLGGVLELAGTIYPVFELAGAIARTRAKGARYAR